jgi:NhaP-type Na+/H+ or K+/H+ antiporter
VAGNLGIVSLFEAIGFFLLVFFTSLVIGVIVGVGTALILKYTLIRRFPKIESCLVILIAYACYFFSNGVHMSGNDHQSSFASSTISANVNLQESSRSCSVESP